MVWKALALLALFSQDVVAQTGSAKGSDFLRFACSQLVVDRVDPLVNPGLVPASHMHQIVGGSSFNATVGCLSYDPDVQYLLLPDGSRQSRSPYGVQMHLL